MDSALLEERKAFKRKAMAIPVVEGKKKAKEHASSSSSSSSKAKQKSDQGQMSQSAKAKLDLAQMKSMASGSSQFRFGVLAKIVRHMKARHMEGDDHPLRLDEILDETNQLDVGTKTRVWLEAEALRNNPKVTPTNDGKYVYKPPYDIMTKKALIRLLKQHDLKGYGGIYLEDVQESLPKCDKIIRNLKEDKKVIEVTRPNDKKKVLFYHDHTSDFEVDDEFKKLWRSVAVDSLDDAQIEEHLSKQGISAMQDNGLKKVAPKINRRKPARFKKRALKDNEHVSDVMVDYNEMTADKANK